MLENLTFSPIHKKPAKVTSKSTQSPNQLGLWNKFSVPLLGPQEQVCRLRLIWSKWKLYRDQEGQWRRKSKYILKLCAFCC